MRLHRLVCVYSCQNATLLEITCRGSFISFPLGCIARSINATVTILINCQLDELIGARLRQCVCVLHNRSLTMLYMRVINIFTERSKAVLLLLIICVIYVFASVYCCLMVTCWKRADILALVSGV